MTATYPVHLNSTSGTLRYNNDISSAVDSTGNHVFRSRPRRPSVIRIVKVDSHTDSETVSTRTRGGVKSRPASSSRSTSAGKRSKTGKLATSRDNPLRLLRSAIAAQYSTTPKQEDISAPRRRHSGPRTDMPLVDVVGRHGSRPDYGDSSTNLSRISHPIPIPDPQSHNRSFSGQISGPIINNSSSTTLASSHLRTSVDDSSRKSSQQANKPGTRPRNSSSATMSGAAAAAQANASNLDERPVAQGSGVSVSINLAEPVLYLQGYDAAQPSTTALLRGNLHLRVTRSAKLKAVTLRFRGVAVTRWPEGIPPKKVEFEETNNLLSHTWPFFNAQFPVAEKGTGADIVRLSSGATERGVSPAAGSSPANSAVHLPLQRRRSIDAATNTDSSRLSSTSVAAKGYRTFHPGEYIYNFELPIDSRLPETIDVDLGTVRYELEASIERAGAFRANLYGSKEVTIIRAPAEGSLEHVEPIAISRNWEDQLHYDIVISGKSFPLGSKVPIAFKLTPLAKVHCHRVKVFVTENVEYFCSNKRVHRLEPTRKILLFEKRSDNAGVSTFPGSSMRITAGGGVPFEQREAAARGEDVIIQDPANLLGRLESDSNVGPTEMEFSVQLPSCPQSLPENSKMHRLHFDTTYQNIQVHHWIKIVMRLSRPDADDSSKRRHFEISIDSPFHILSCRATQANIELPAYATPRNSGVQYPHLSECGCPGAAKRRLSPSQMPSPDNGMYPPLQPDGRLRAASEGTAPGFSSTGRASAPQRLPLDNNGASNATAPNGLQINTDIAFPQAAHTHSNTPRIQRPMHMVRAPSFNPPAFEAEEPPPPLVTPPPQYNDIASPTNGLADYFSRLAEVYDDLGADADEDGSPGDDNDGGISATRRSGRVTVPLTPGGSVSRSMELRRDWLPVGR